MNIRNLVAAGALVLTMAGAGIPTTAQASQHHLKHKIHRAIRHRKSTEGQWRAGTYAGAALGAIGLATHKDTLTAIGAGVAGYSGYRWSQDIKSRHRLQRKARHIRHRTHH